MLYVCMCVYCMARHGMAWYVSDATQPLTPVVYSQGGSDPPGCRSAKRLDEDEVDVVLGSQVPAVSMNAHLPCLP